MPTSQGSFCGASVIGLCLGCDRTNTRHGQNPCRSVRGGRVPYKVADKTPRPILLTREGEPRPALYALLFSRVRLLRYRDIEQYLSLPPAQRGKRKTLCLSRVHQFPRLTDTGNPYISVEDVSFELRLTEWHRPSRETVSNPVSFGI